MQPSRYSDASGSDLTPAHRSCRLVGRTQETASLAESQLGPKLEKKTDARTFRSGRAATMVKTSPTIPVG